MRNLVVCVLLAALASVAAYGQSAKATAKVDELISVGVSTGPVDLADAAAVARLAWTDILEQTIRVPSQKDLFIDASLECGLYTRTKVSTSGGILDTAEADAGIRVRVVIDKGTDNEMYALPDQGRLLYKGGAALPGATAVGAGVSYCRRWQQLSAKLQGILTCGAGVAIPDACTLTAEEIELVLSTLDANAFNFIVPDLTSGNHTVTVQAVGIALPTADDSSSNAYLGAGSVTIETVRMIKGEDVIDLQ